MKTPREILFERHRPAEYKLDQIRQKAVADLAARTKQTERSLPVGIALKLWCELIWPARRIWTGLAAAWVVVLIANANLSEGQPAMAKDARPASDMFLALREQERVLAELVDKVEPQVAEPPKRSAPQPRSEGKFVQLVG